MITETEKQSTKIDWLKKVIHRDMKIRRSDPTRDECLEAPMSPAQQEVFLVINEWWRKYGLPTPKPALTRAEIRRRIAVTPPTLAMVRHMVKTIKKQNQEIACLRNKLGC
jgi:hypothetical protein